jgi:hypothetical protein
MLKLKHTNIAYAAMNLTRFTCSDMWSMVPMSLAKRA